MDTTIRVGRVTISRFHHVRCGEQKIGTILVTTDIADGEEETHITAHVHVPTHVMLDTAADVTHAECVAAIVASYEAFVTARDAAVQP